MLALLRLLTHQFLLSLRLLTHRALLAQGRFALQALLVLRVDQLRWLALLFAPDPLFGLGSAALWRWNRQGTHGGRLNGYSAGRSGRYRRGRQETGCAIAALEPSCARVIRTLIRSVWEGTPVIAMLALAAYHGLRCHCGRRHGGWC